MPSSPAISSDDDGATDGALAKKRRIQRACDICRRKKSDGAQMPKNRCSNCITYKLDCTYVEAAKKRGPPKGYVEKLESRLEKMEALMTKLCPGVDVAAEFGDAPARDLTAHSAWPDEGIICVPPGERDDGIMPSKITATEITTNYIRQVGSRMRIADELFPADDDLGHHEITRRMKELHMDIHTADPVYNRFFGKSSGISLVQTAIDLRSEATGYPSQEAKYTSLLGARRPEFWAIRPWELAATVEPMPDYTFPEPDLMTTLIDLYFTNVNVFNPILHRPTFERDVARGFHKEHDRFAATLLLVCALGSRYTEDPRVLLDGHDSLHSGGWKWFQQVQMVHTSLLLSASLYHLQFYCLSVLYLQGTSAPQATWTLIGIGIRLAQDVGAHRRKLPGHKLTVQDELWKRAFWLLVHMDRQIGAILGRPCSIQDEDIDIDFPVECDDEFWENEDPEKAFQQPPGRPSTVAYFNCQLKLDQVQALCLRTIYSINKSKILLGFVGERWEQHIVTELDSALNKWVDSVPDHLRWDPKREDELFFGQSVSLYISYYHLQILIHRPFIPSARHASPLSYPSLAICTNAARSCSHIADIHSRRSDRPLPHIQVQLFASGIVLMLVVWGGRRAGLSVDPNKELRDVHKCMQVLHKYERRWHSAGRFWDILYELASVGELPLPQSPPPSNKRDRGADSPSAAVAPSSTPTAAPGPGPRSFAGSRRVFGREPLPAGLHSPPEQPSVFTLPMYSGELGGLPVNGAATGAGVAQQPLDPGRGEFWYPTPPEEMPALNGSGEVLPGGVSAGGGGTGAPAFSMDELFFDPAAGVGAPVPLFAQGPGLTGGLYQPGAGDGGQALGGLSWGAEPLLDDGTFAMWSNAPSGFELDDWGTYLTNVSELTHGVGEGSGR